MYTVSGFVFLTAVTERGFYSYCKLVLHTPKLKTGSVYTCTVNWSCVHLNFELDRQVYHTDGPLHMRGNVQGTNRSITLTDHYT